MALTTFLFLLLAVFAGTLLSFQSAVNGQLARVIDNTLLAAFVSFAIGTVALFAVLLVRNFSSPLSLPDWSTVSPVLYLGGVLGATYVAIIALLVPKIGVANTAVALILGQVLLSLLLDHFGVFGFDARTVSWSRLSGAALVVLGMLLVVK